MAEDSIHMKTTKVEVENGNATIHVPLPSSLGDDRGGGRAKRMKNYHDILQSRCLYYPVAYRFDRELGRGRQGVVFLGRRHGARGCVTRHAIKLFDPSIYPSAKKYWMDMGRIADQISRLQSINSPNLVLRDIYEEINGIGYIQMEVINGLDVQRLLDGDHVEIARKNCRSDEWAVLSDALFRFTDGRVAIQPGVALYILRRVLRGLEPLHKLNFLHSDIKPANIMIDHLGNVKVIDFGRAVRIHEDVSYLFGTPLYMAPEFHRREPPSNRADLYSVGVLALEMLYGEPFVDFRNMNEKELLKAKLELPSRLNSLVPKYVAKNPELMRLLHRLLDPEPANRYASAAEVESGPEGLSLVHKQLTFAGKDTEYDRVLEAYLSKILPRETRD